jgi:hypothetical protein
MWLFIGLPILVIFAMLTIHARETLDEIKSNWTEYRCNPAYMPFANIINSETTVGENFSYCLNVLGTEVWKRPLDSLNSMFATTGESLSEITGSLGLFRGMFGRMRKFMLSFTISTLSKAASSTSVFVHYLIKIRDIFQRFVGQGYISAYLTQVIVAFIESFAMLFMSILKTFIYIMLAISFILALFQPQLLAIVLVLTSIVAASGG